MSLKKYILNHKFNILRYSNLLALNKLHEFYKESTKTDKIFIY